MEVRPGYKQTEVGVIPEEWDARQIRDVCTLINGRGFKPHEWKTAGLPIIRIQNLNGSEDFNFYSGQYNPKILVEHGQLLFAWSGSRGTSFGPYVWNGRRALLNYHTWKVVVNESRATPEFFLHALRQLTSFIEDRAHGASALVHTQKWEMEKFPVPIPARLPEQRAIAEALDDVDALLGALDRLIAKKRDLKQAAMQQLLTGQTRLPGFHGEWEVKRLGEVAHIKTGSRNNEDKVEDGQYRFFVRSEVIEHINSYSHDCEAILVPGEGRIGSIFHYIHGRFDVHQRVYAITQFRSDISAKFVHLYMTKNFGAWAMQNTVKATVDSLRLPTFQNFQMTLPPTLDEQTAIAEVLTDMDAELAGFEQRREKTRALKQGMMQELLTGRTRLV
ncbi:MAG: restriction endonuclease subunit S [Rhodoplanes sp.]